MACCGKCCSHDYSQLVWGATLGLAGGAHGGSHGAGSDVDGDQAYAPARTACTSLLCAVRSTCVVVDAHAWPAVKSCRLAPVVNSIKQSQAALWACTTMGSCATAHNDLHLNLLLLVISSPLCMI